MALPVAFGSLNQATGAQLDQNFAALGALTPVPGTLAGTNALTFTQLGNTPTVPAFADGNSFVGIAVNANTGSVTFALGGLGPLNVYKDTSLGPELLSGGEIVQNNVYGFRYDSTLNTGAGGFHLENYAVMVTAFATLTFTPLLANASQDQAVSTGLALARPNDLVMLGPPTSVIAGVMYQGFVTAPGTVTVRAINITAASLTPTGGTFRIGLKGAG